MKRLKNFTDYYIVSIKLSFYHDFRRINNMKFGYLAELNNVRKAGLLDDGHTLSGASIKEVIDMGLVVRKHGYSALTNKGFWRCILTIPIYLYYKAKHKM
jgi:hypothetical protein